MSRHTAEKRAAFRALHKDGCFVLPNPWDVGSARYLASAGFKAIATTSSGFAWSTGRPDNGVSRDAILAHLREMVGATDLPVNADFENGFGDDPAEVAHSVRMAVDTGIAGLSIEDSTGDPKSPLFPLDVAVKRLAAARRAIDETGGDTLLVGRAENFFVGVARSRRRSCALTSLCTSRRRLPVRAGHPDARADRGRGRRRGAETRQSADRFDVGVHAAGRGRARRAAHQCRRRTRARGMGRAGD
jgi:2-methylisocitrate lyase-like PEP mutase family enzyme